MFEVIEAVPAVDEFCDLRIAAGLSAMDRTAAAAALPRSLHAVTIRDGERLIGMGRVVGDGLHVQVTDIAEKIDISPDAKVYTFNLKKSDASASVRPTRGAQVR